MFNNLLYVVSTSLYLRCGTHAALQFTSVAYLLLWPLSRDKSAVAFQVLFVHCLSPVVPTSIFFDNLGIAVLLSWAFMGVLL